MKKVIGYIVSLLGVGVLALGVGVLGDFALLGLDSINNYYLIIGGVMLVGVGLFLVRFSGEGGGVKKGAEIPIYEGSGKKRRIVGYQRVR